MGKLNRRTKTYFIFPFRNKKKFSIFSIISKDPFDISLPLLQIKNIIAPYDFAIVLLRLHYANFFFSNSLICNMYAGSIVELHDSFVHCFTF